MTGDGGGSSRSRRRWQRAAETKLFFHQRAVATGVMKIGFRCKECGLLKGSGAELLKHVKDCHTHEGAPRRTNYCESSLLSPDEVLRPSCVFRPSMSERPLAWAMSAEQACLGLGARQEGAAAPSLFELERLFNLFGILLSYACLPGDLLGVGPDTRGEALSFLECLKFFVVVLGSPQCKPLWSSVRPYMRWCTQYVATGLWRGCCLSRFSALAPLREQMASRKKCAAVLACSAVQQATLQASAFFKALRRGFYEEVLLSHGNHVPIAVRDYATVLFWLPDVLEAVQAKSVDFWKLARVCMPKVAAYVGNQVSMYDWPSTEQLVLQYYTLMRRWSVLIGSPDVRCKAYPARKRSCLGAEPAKEGVLFDWRWWWKQSHTDPRFRPVGTEGAFTLFHFLGMLGISEARAESVASLLKRYSPAKCAHLGVDRVMEKTTVRCAGVAADGLDDLLLLRCWQEFFGGLDARHFSFDLKRHAARARKRDPVAGGSRVIRRHLKPVRISGPWRSSARALRCLRARPGLGGLRGTLAWHMSLARRA